MSGYRKGVVTVGATFTPAEDSAVAPKGWQLDSGRASGAGGAAPCAEVLPHGSDLVHEVIDHWIPGFALAGPVAEGKALVQYAARTGIDPTQDLQGVVDHLLGCGGCEGSALAALAPPDLLHRLPRAHRSDEEGLRRLREWEGNGLLRARMTAHLLERGWDGMALARATWLGRGLDFRRRTPLALSLGRLEAWMEQTVREEGWPQAHGELAVASDMVRFRFDLPGPWEWAREVGSP